MFMFRGWRILITTTSSRPPVSLRVTQTLTTTWDTLVFTPATTQSTPFTRAFGTLDDTRAMKGNGAIYEYCIPRDTDYGAAVTGIKDASGTTRPVSLKVDRWNEPNLYKGCRPDHKIRNHSGAFLDHRERQVLAGPKYNNHYHNVPTNNYLSSAFNASTAFAATNTTQTFSDNFMSSATVIYRCVPALASTLTIDSLQLAGADVRIKFMTQTNKLYGVDYRNDLASGSWTNLTNNVAGTGSLMTITDPGAISRARRFYRIFMTTP